MGDKTEEHDVSVKPDNHVAGHQPELKRREKVYEEELLKRISKTHSITTFLQSFGLDILLYGAVFIAGQRKMSALYMIPPIVILVLKDIICTEWERRQFDEIIKILRDEEKPLVLANAGDLPPWVHYPDVERCNWLNKLMFHFWPHITNMVKEEIEQKIQPDLSKRVKGLKFRRLSMGSVPPTISGIKVYDKKVSSSHLILDVNLSYSGDCEFRFSFFGIPGGMENFQLHGAARLDFLIIQTLPFIGGVEFSFLGLPRIDFVLTGAGSLGFTEETVRKVIDNKINANFVFPKKLRKVWVPEKQEIIKDPLGVIRVNVIEAKNLENKDYSGVFAKGNLSDPYAEVTFGSKTVYSRVVDDDLNPTWDMWCEFVAEKSNEKLVIRVFDKDVDNDDLIGTYSVSAQELQKLGKLDDWVSMEGSKGKLHVRITFLETTADSSQVLFPPDQLSFLSTYVLTVLVQSAHNLMIPRGMTKPSAKVQLIVGNDTQETKEVKKNENPFFGETFHFAVNNPDFNKLRAKVLNVDEGSDEIGEFAYSLRKLLDRNNMEIIDQHFPLLDSATESSVVVSLRLKAIKNEFF